MRSQDVFLGSLCGCALGYASVYYLSKYLSLGAGEHEKAAALERHHREAQRAMQTALEDEILSEQFTRNKQFFGSQGQQAVHEAFVIVVGLGVSSLLMLSTKELPEDLECRGYQRRDKQGFLTLTGARV